MYDFLKSISRDWETAVIMWSYEVGSLKNQLQIGFFSHLCITSPLILHEFYKDYLLTKSGTYFDKLGQSSFLSGSNESFVLGLWFPYNFSHHRIVTLILCLHLFVPFFCNDIPGTTAYGVFISENTKLRMLNKYRNFFYAMCIFQGVTSHQ